LGGVGGTPEGCINVTPFIDALQANDPFNRSPTVALPCCAPRALHRRASDNAVRHPAFVRVGAARPNGPWNASIRLNHLPPPAFGRLADGRARSSRGEQGRRVSASRTTVLRDGAKVWRPRRAGYPIPHGADLAAAGRYDRTRAETAHSPTATASSAQKRQEGIIIGIELNAL